MKNILNLLFLSCLKATELMERKFHLKLTLKENLQLKMHKMMCEACTKYEKQSLLIEKGMAKLESTEPSGVDLEALKSKISAKIEGIHE